MEVYDLSERRLSCHFLVLCEVIPIPQPPRRAALPASIERLSHALKIVGEPIQDPEYPENVFIHRLHGAAVRPQPSVSNEVTEQPRARKHGGMTDQEH